MKYYNIVFFTILISFANSDILQQEFYFVNQVIYFQVNIANCKTIYRAVDQQAPYSLFNESVIKSENKLSEEIFLISNKQIKANLHSDSLTINESLVLNDFNFYLSNETNLYGEMFSMAYKPYNNNFSLIHILHDKGIIEKMQYTIYGDTDEGGVMYLGGVPEEIKEMKKYKGKCDLIDEKWSCIMNSVYLGDKEYVYDNKKGEVLFQTKERYIITPRNFIIFMCRAINQNANDNNACTIEANKNEEYLNCFAGKNNIIKNITFNIGEYSFFSRIENWFFCINNRCRSFFYSDMSKEYGDTWVLGSAFIRQYISTFDYDERTITLYNNIGIFLYRDNNAKIIRVLLISIIFILLCGLILYFIIGLIQYSFIILK